MRKICLLLLFLAVSFLPASAQRFTTGVSLPIGCQTLGTLTCDSNGWTQFTIGSASAPGTFGEGTGYNGTGTRVIYVDQVNGNDANDGSFTASGGGIGPVQNPWQGMKDVRSGHPDWVLLRCGQTWTDNALGELGTAGLSLGGADANHPMLVSSYDAGASHNPPVPNPASCSARPIMQTTAIWRNVSPYGPEPLLIKGASGAGNNMAFVGFAFYCMSRDPANGLFNLDDAQAIFVGPSPGNATANILFEDVSVSFYGSGIAFGSMSSVFIRRSEFVSNYPDVHDVGQGIASSFMLDGPTGYNFYENVIDKNGWNADGGIKWAPQSGRNHNVYMSQNNVNGDTSTTGTPASFIGNLVSNDGGASLFEVGGLFENNFFALEPTPVDTQAIVNVFAHVISGNVITNPYNLLASGNNASAITIAGRSFFGYLGYQPGATIAVTGNYIVNSTVDPNASGIEAFPVGVSAVTISGNVLYNWGTGIVMPSGGLLTQHVSTPGTGYTDNSSPITAAASSNVAGQLDGKNYIVVTVNSTAGIQGNGNTFYQVGSGAILGPFPSAVLGPTTIEIYGTSFTSSFTGTLYFPYYIVPLTNVSSTCAGSPTADVTSAGGHIIDVNTGGSDGPLEKKSTAGNSCVAGDTLTATIPGSSGFVVTLDTVTSNTVASSGCNTTTNNVVDLTGTNACGFTDPGRSVGSYVAQNAVSLGTTANSTFTGVVANGVLTITSQTGSIYLGDAVTWAGQTKQDFIKFYSGGVINALGSLSASACSLSPHGGCNNQIGTLGSITATPCSASPLGCANGTYTNVPLVDVGGFREGSNATATVIVTGGPANPTVTTVTYNSGTSDNNYSVGDTLNVDPTSIGGSGGGAVNFTVPVATLAGLSGSYTGVALVGGHGYGASANVTVTSGIVTSITKVNSGVNYIDTDILVPDSASIGGYFQNLGDTNASIPIASFSATGGHCVSGANCTGTGSNSGGTYALTGSNPTVGSQAMSSWTTQQFINAARNQSKAAWNTNLTACAINKYIKAGFGVTDPCDVNQ